MAAKRRSAAIVRAEKQVVGIQQLTREDLMSPEAVESLVRTASEIDAEAKAFTGEKKKVNDKAKSLYADELAEAGKVTLYGFEVGKKLTVSASGGGVEVDDDGVYAGLCELYGCDPEEPSDEVMKLWYAMTVPQPRALDEHRVAEVMARNPEVRGVVLDNTKEKKPTLRASVTNLTKAEQAAYERGDLTDNVVVG